MSSIAPTTDSHPQFEVESDHELRVTFFDDNDVAAAAVNSNSDSQSPAHTPLITHNETQPEEFKTNIEHHGVVVHTFDPPSTPATTGHSLLEIERLVLEICAQEFQASAVSSTSAPIQLTPEQDLFEYGGTSEDVVRIVGRLKLLLSCESLSASDMFQNPTARDFARAIQTKLEQQQQMNGGKEKETNESPQPSPAASIGHSPSVSPVSSIGSSGETLDAAQFFGMTIGRTAVPISINNHAVEIEAAAGSDVTPLVSPFEWPIWWPLLQVFYMLLMWASLGASLAAAWIVSDQLSTDPNSFGGSRYLAICCNTGVFGGVTAAALLTTLVIWKNLWDVLCFGRIEHGVVERSWMQRSRHWFLSTYFSSLKVVLQPLCGTCLLPAYLRMLGANIGRNVEIHTTGFDFCSIHLLQIDDDVYLAPGVSVSTTSSAHLKGEIVSHATSIGRQSVVEDSAAIDPNVAVPVGCRIQALAVVTQNNSSLLKSHCTFTTKGSIYCHDVAASQQSGDLSSEYTGRVVPGANVSLSPNSMTLQKTWAQHGFQLVALLLVGVETLQPAIFFQWLFAYLYSYSSPDAKDETQNWFYHNQMEIIRYALFPGWMLVWTAWACVTAIVMLRLVHVIGHVFCPLVLSQPVTQNDTSENKNSAPPSKDSTTVLGCEVGIASWQYIIHFWLPDVIHSTHPYNRSFLVVTRLAPLWMRLCGASVALSAVIMGPLNTFRLPLWMVCIDAKAHLMNGVNFSPVRVLNGKMFVAPIHIGRDALLANHCTIASGVVLEPKSTVATLSLVFPTPQQSSHKETESNSKGLTPLYLGAPAKRSKFRARVGGEKSAKEFLLPQLLVSLLGLISLVVIVAIQCICLLPGMLVLQRIYDAGASTQVVLALLVPVLYIISTPILLIALVLVKWVVMFKYNSNTQHHFRSVWFQRYTLFHLSFHNSPLLRGFIAPYLGGTKFLNVLYRAMGAKIGNGCYFGAFDVLTDYDLHTVGNHVVMSGAANPFCHFIHRGRMCFEKLEFKSYSNLSDNVHVVAGSTLERGAKADMNTCIDKGQLLPAYTVWQGVPSRLVKKNQPRFAAESLEEDTPTQLSKQLNGAVAIDVKSDAEVQMATKKVAVWDTPAFTERVWLNLPSGDNAPGVWDMPVDPTDGLRHSLLWFIYKQVKENPDGLATVWVNDQGKDELKLTFVQIWRSAVIASLAIRDRLKALGKDQEEPAENFKSFFPDQMNLAEFRPGRPRILLCYSFDLSFIVGFLATLLANCIAVPVYPPDPSSAKRSLAKMHAIINVCQPALAITNTQMNRFRQFQNLTSSGAWPKDLEWIVTDPEAGMKAPTKQEVIDSFDFLQQPVARDVHPQALAFLQFTSGSTGLPKGVCINHKNLLHQVSGICRHHVREHEGKKMIFQSWLPPFHDFGLMAMHLSQLYSGGTGYFMSPLSFLQFPPLWLLVCSRVRATITGSPNFGLELAVRKYDLIKPAQKAKLDLSNLLHLIMGAEPIRLSTLNAFIDIYGKKHGFDPRALKTGFGLAENVFGVAQCYQTKLTVQEKETDDPFHKRDFFMCQPPRNADGTVGFGATVGGVQSSKSLKQIERHDEPLLALGNHQDEDRLCIAIVDPETLEEMPDGQVGEMWISSPSLAVAYWKMKEQSEETFYSHIKENHLTPSIASTPILSPSTIDGSSSSSSSSTTSSPADSPRSADGVALILKHPKSADESPEAVRQRRAANRLHVSRWLRSGDLAFVLDGCLYYSGRIKEIIIYRGQKHHPHDIEATVAEADAQIRAGCVAAWAENPEVASPASTSSSSPASTNEQLIVVCEVRNPLKPTAAYEELCSIILARVRSGHGLVISRLILIDARSICKTSSGKIARRETKKLLEEGKIKVLFEKKTN